MLDKLDEIVARHQAINDQLMRPDISPKDLVELNKERVQIDPIVEKYSVLKSNQTELEDNKVLLEDEDDEIKSMAKEEIQRLTKENAALEKELQILLLPKDPDDEKNIIIEFAQEQVATRQRYLQANSSRCTVAMRSKRLESRSHDLVRGH